MTKVTSLLNAALLVLVLVLQASAAYGEKNNSVPHNAPKNIYGGPLEACSEPGMALTGYTRTGYCVNENDDIGSHHVCIDLSSTTGGNFCTVTRQPDWCSSLMPCHNDYNQSCPIQNWCVCQWAFASYIEKAGGCDHIQNVQCNAVNMQTLNAYRKSSQKRNIEALKCLESKCGLSEE